MNCIQEASEEFFGMVCDGLIYAAIFTDGRIWARKTSLPENLLDIAEIKAMANIPEHIQRLCDEANTNWLYGTDRSWG